MKKNEFFKYIVIGITSEIDLRKSITKIRVLCKSDYSYYWVDSNKEEDNVYWWLFNSRSEAESKAEEILGNNNYIIYGISFVQSLYPMKIWKWFEK